VGIPSVTVADCLYWLLTGNSFGMPEFDLDRQSLGLVPMPGKETFAEENNAVLLRTSIDIFTVQLESLQFRKLSQSNFWYGFYPFKGFYTAGIMKSSYLVVLLLVQVRDSKLLSFLCMCLRKIKLNMMIVILLRVIGQFFE
jgi:hypothetical protein